MLGVAVLLVPYLGVPASWKSVLLVVIGFVLLMVGFFLRTEALARGGKTSRSHTFVENSLHAAPPQSSHDRQERIGSLN